MIRYGLDDMGNANGTAIPEYNMMFKCKTWKFLENDNNNKKCLHSFLLVEYIRSTIIIQVKLFQTQQLNQQRLSDSESKQGHKPKEEVSAIYPWMYVGKTRK